MDREDTRAATVAAIYDAGFNPAHWPRALRHIARQCDAPTTLFVMLNRRSDTLVTTAQYNLDPRSIKLYDAYFKGCDIWSRGAFRRPIGTVSLAHELVHPDEFRHSEFYNDFLSRFGLADVATCTFAAGTDLVGFLSLLQGRRGPRFGRHATARLSLLRGHVQRAAALTNLVLRRAPLPDSTLECWNSANVAMFHLDNDLRMRHGNPAAHRMIGAGAPFVLHGDRLRLRDPKTQAELAHAVAGVSQRLGIPGQEAATDIVVEDEPNGTLFTIAVAPISPTWSGSLLMRRPGAVLVVAAEQMLPQHAVRKHFLGAGLSPAETDVALLAATGMAPRSIAERREVRVSTVRVQLRCIYSKLDVHRQAELMASVAALRSQQP